VYGAIVPPATLAFDLEEIRPSSVGAGGQPSAQAVAAHFGCVQHPRLLSTGCQDSVDTPLVQRHIADAAPAADTPEQRSLFDLSDIQPAPQCLRWTAEAVAVGDRLVQPLALLIGFGARQRDLETFPLVSCGGIRLRTRAVSGKLNARSSPPGAMRCHAMLIALRAYSSTPQ